ncbi:MAG TPA: peptidyl-alpha-hydroxyglycine alpha-amidating lyase family protein [Steroidobacteraceae bacterium]|nr:peptidyl-alpha-hydroxyglycine alpha-amidating lyase family protein [Steroidobacteraceae bacterium]
MKIAARSVSFLGAALVGACVLSAVAATTNAPNSQPNPYRRIDNFFKMPPGRTMGSSSAVGVDHQGHIWVAERCGANSCANSKIDPIMEFDAGGNFIKAFGGGMMVFPHGFFIDMADHIWVTDAQAGDGKGDDVLEFDQNGKLLRTLGKPGIAGNGPDSFNEPSAVLVAPNGDIFVGDGHEEGKGNARIVKLDKNGVFLRQWGSHGSGPGQIEVPHTLAMDSRGRLFVGDRGNSRIQIFSQDGKLLDTWTQFSRPSGLFIDQNDVLYVTDSESRNAEGYGHHPGWTRGIRIGSTKDGVVTAFIPDPDHDAETKSTTGAEGITADVHGNIYGAEVGPKDVVKYEKK